MGWIKLIDLKIIDVSFFFYNFNIFFLDNNIPGPNAYGSKSLVGNKNFNSKFKTAASITMSQRFNYRDLNYNNPGPGAYLRFSEFGILVPKKKCTTERSNSKQEEKSEEKEEKKN